MKRVMRALLFACRPFGFCHARTQMAALGGHEALATTEARIRSLELARDFSERVTDQGLQLVVADVDPLLPHLPARSDIGERLDLWRAYESIRDTDPSTPEKTATSLVQALPTDFSLDPDTFVTRVRRAFGNEIETLQRSTTPKLVESRSMPLPTPEMVRSLTRTALVPEALLTAA